jgi:hypothetical protein
MKAGPIPRSRLRLRKGVALLDARREKVVYDFCTELLETTQLTDATYAAAVKLFGEQGVIGLIGALSFYSMVSMISTQIAIRYPMAWSRH